MQSPPPLTSYPPALPNHPLSTDTYNTMTYYDPSEGLNDDMQKEGIADRMYKRLHDSDYQQPSAKPKPKGAVRPPIALTCYLCGQQFGTASLEIHQKQCYAKKLLQWERGDPDTRGPRPTLRAEPQQSDEPVGNYSAMSAKEVEKFNNNQFQDFQEKALVPCENCGRTFFPDRLQVHLRSCKPGSSSRPVRKGEPSSPSERPQPKRANSGADYRPRSDSEPRLPTHPTKDANSDFEAFMDRRGNDTKSATSNDTANSSPSLAGHAVHRPSIPIIPHLQLGAQVAQKDDYADEDTNGNHQDDDGFQSVGSHDFQPDMDGLDDTYDEPTAPAPRKPKVSIDRPLDLSHVQSRFKAAAVTNLERCQFCKRTFAPDRLARHEDVCIEKKTIRTGGPIGMTPRVGAKAVEPIIRPTTSSGTAAARSGAATSRVSGAGPTSRNMDNGPMTTRGGPSNGGSKPVSIIRPANASSRPQSPTVNRPPSRSPPPGQRASLDRAATNDKASTKSSVSAARPVSPSPTTTRVDEPRPKFCTECGHKLFAVTQKFCGECGFPVTTAV